MHMRYIIIYYTVLSMTVSTINYGGTMNTAHMLLYGDLLMTKSANAIALQHTWPWSEVETLSFMHCYIIYIHQSHALL